MTFTHGLCEMQRKENEKQIESEENRLHHKDSGATLEEGPSNNERLDVLHKTFFIETHRMLVIDGTI